MFTYSIKITSDQSYCNHYCGHCMLPRVPTPVWCVYIWGLYIIGFQITTKRFTMKTLNFFSEIMKSNVFIGAPMNQCWNTHENPMKYHMKTPWQIMSSQLVLITSCIFLCWPAYKIPFHGCTYETLFLLYFHRFWGNSQRVFMEKMSNSDIICAPWLMICISNLQFKAAKMFVITYNLCYKVFKYLNFSKCKKLCNGHKFTLLFT